MARAIAQITMTRAKIVDRTARGKQRHYDRSRNLFMRACRAYVQALAQEIGKHVDTGMSFASVVPFARFVNAVGVDMPVATSLPKKWVTSMATGKAIVGRKKSITEGLKAGRIGSAFNVKEGSPNRPIFQMWFSIQVFQYYLHEYGYQTPAWNSLSKARNAYAQVLVNHEMDSRRKNPLDDFRDVEYVTIKR